MASNQQFCLRWNNHQSTVISVFDSLLESGTLVDCTLAAEGQYLKAHKVVLSACSPYFEALLSQHYEQHPIIILKDVMFLELKSMLDYMYRGEVNISQVQLGSFLKAAESLQIKGLTDRGATSECRDLEFPRDMNHIDRSPSVQKRMEVKKQHLYSSSKPPLFGNLSSNLFMNLDNQKPNKLPLQQDTSSGGQKLERDTQSRERSLSPPSKIKHQYPSFFPPHEDHSMSPNSLENNHHKQNHKLETISKESVPIPEKTVPDTLPIPAKHNSKYNNRKSECGNFNDSDVIKNEMKMDTVDFPELSVNDSSVEDIAADEDQEEMDDDDFDKPGPSTATNSHVAGVPWHSAREGNGEELLLARQHEAQGDSTQFQCPKCLKKYSSAHTLRRHMRLECGKEPKFFCPYCTHRTKQRYNLMLHIGRTHREVITAVSTNL